MKRTALATLATLLAGCPRAPVTDAATDAADAQDDAPFDAPLDADAAPIACDAQPAADGGLGIAYTDPREPCSDRNPQRNLYWGDLHVHTQLSFDAYAVDVRTTPEMAYRYARGEAVDFYGANGPRHLQLSRPLDFAAVTDHSEFLGEVDECITPGSVGFNSLPCRTYRDGGSVGYAAIAYRLAFTNPRRDVTVCGAGGADCVDRTRSIWQRIQRAANEAYDRSASCRFTSFVAYEYSPSPSGNNLHRNVIFRNERVPPLPISYFEAPTAESLWTGLRDGCTNACTGCEMLVIPHNSNISAGHMFPIAPRTDIDLATQRELAELRNRTERLVEVYQHKGSSECRADLSPFGAPDEACSFEIIHNTLAGGVNGMPMPTPPCTGSSGVGCYAPQDFTRHVLTNGLVEANRLGVNPFQLGAVASTDTHNGSAGEVDETRFRGHVGSQDFALLSHPDNSPGGLAAVWSIENSRDAIFEALRRRETYATSGPRIALRFFGGFGYPATLCANGTLVERGYSDGVPMGGTLPPRPAAVGAPSFIVQALRDEHRLARAQIVKGWVDRSGAPHEQVFDVEVASGAPGVDENTCTANGDGADTMCSVWTDPSFDPTVRAYWYARALEAPSCRWTQYQCIAMPASERPAACSDPTVPRTIQERAISSPIWWEP